MEEPQEMSAEQQSTPASEQQSEAKNMNINTNNNAPSDEAARIAELEAQLAQARQEAADNWNKYLRERAEQDNFRKRQERVLGDRVLHQKKALFPKLLDVMDNVDRAMVYQDTLDKAQLLQTLRMLHWQLNEVLRSEGLAPITTVGETFNPYLHEAIEAVESSEHPEGIIIEEARKGYMLGEEVLRPARVKVSMGNNNNK